MVLNAPARTCPALLISAPASHQGKTTLTAALARYHRDQGRQVRVFKTGPDFLDPFILEQASGAPVYGLDLWMHGEAECQQRLYDAAQSADLILVEGAMGLFDGTPSSADLAERFGLPVVVVMDGSAMAQTFGALAWGLSQFRPSLTIAGVVANRVGSAHHAALLRESLPDGVTDLGYLPREVEMSLPERHLGLVQAQEIDDLDARIAQAARHIAATALAALPAAQRFLPPAESDPIPPRLAGQRIAIARDRAFSFLYPANVHCLEAMGATLVYFSPLADEALPECDALYLPGGYPELYLPSLQQAQRSAASIRAHHQAGKAIYAECGGMLYALAAVHQDGQRWPLLGLLEGEAVMQKTLAGLGLQAMQRPEGELRGHTFHYSRIETTLTPISTARRATRATAGEGLYAQGSLLATYLHAHFPSNPTAAAGLFLRD